MITPRDEIKNVKSTKTCIMLGHGVSGPNNWVDENSPTAIMATALEIAALLSVSSGIQKANLTAMARRPPESTIAKSTINFALQAVSPQTAPFRIRCNARPAYPRNDASATRSNRDNENPDAESALRSLGQERLLRGGRTPRPLAGGALGFFRKRSRLRLWTGRCVTDGRPGQGGSPARPSHYKELSL